MLLDSYKNCSLPELEQVKAGILEALQEGPMRLDAQAALVEVNELIKNKTPIMKFYHVTNANRVINAVGPDNKSIAFQFHPYENVGCWLGAYATEKPEEIAALDESVKNPKSGITELTQEQYETCIKKKVGASNSYAPSLAVSTPTPGIAAAPSAVGNPVETNISNATPAAAPLADVSEAVEVVSVQPKTPQ